MAGAPLRLSATPLERVRERGALTVGIYHDMPPFHVGGKGIDVELAQALAESLGVRLALLPFHADENMNDDLRNMVWRGHYLGYGPADVLLHVPVDRPLMDANPQVSIFAPYCRERVVMARRLERVPRLDTLSQLADRKVAVPGQSLAGWLLIGADGGAYRNQLITQWKNGAEAARALLRGEVAAAGGWRRNSNRSCAATRALPSRRCRRRARRVMDGPWAWPSSATPPNWRRRCSARSTSSHASGRLRADVRPRQCGLARRHDSTCSIV